MAERITICFDTRTSGFEASPATEIAGVLRRMADRIEYSGILPAPKDRNGQVIGYTTVGELRGQDTYLYTYTPDLMRPLCPDCGREVSQGDVNPEEEWIGTCAAGHTHRYLLEDEENEE